jgi:hypothetical protein
MPKSKSPKKNGAAEPVSNVNQEMTSAPGADMAPLTAARNEAGNGQVTTVTTRKARTPDLRKTESRSNLFPINLDDEIRQVAYLMAERRGFEPGHETEDWLNAEREVRGRYHQQTA